MVAKSTDNNHVNRKQKQGDGNMLKREPKTYFENTVKMFGNATTAA